MSPHREDNPNFRAKTSRRYEENSYNEFPMFPCTIMKDIFEKYSLLIIFFEEVHIRLCGYAKVIVLEFRSRPLAVRDGVQLHASQNAVATFIPSFSVARTFNHASFILITSYLMLNESPARLRGSSAISRVKAAATFISTPGEGAEQEHKSHIGHEFKMLSECDRLNAALAMRTVGLTGVPSRICFLRASHFRTPQTRGVQSIPVVRCKRTERPEYGLHVQSQSAKQTYDIRFINTQNFQQFKISALSYTGCLASFLKKNLSLAAKAAFSVQEGRSGFHVLSPTFLKRYHVESDDDELEGIDPELRLCTVRIVHSAIAESTVANIRKTRAATANRGSGGASEKRQQESWQGVRNVYMRIMERSLFRTPVIEMSTSSVIFPPPLASWDATILTFLRSDNDSSEFYCPVKTPGRDLTRCCAGDTQGLTRAPNSGA
ncbi:hypothetical protein C8J57DRAFT_1615375 [Mycena rebaudengoi]|nr:hypothetical protein C8J57DRAFT_1615375 [Mycena rebaudengoi]